MLNTAMFLKRSFFFMANCIAIFKMQCISCLSVFVSISKQFLTRKIHQSIETFLSQKCRDLGMTQTTKL